MKWLSLESVSSKEEHWQKEHWFMWTHESRRACRTELGKLPGAQELLNCERPLSPGESEEPTTMKGLVSVSLETLFHIDLQVRAPSNLFRRGGLGTKLEKLAALCNNIHCLRLSWNQCGCYSMGKRGGAKSVDSHRQSKLDGPGVKRSKLTFGQCTCALCGAKSQDARGQSVTIWVHPITPNNEKWKEFSSFAPCQRAPQDSEWALYQKADDSNADLPAGEQCYTCFHFHQLCFPNLAWQQFLHDYTNNEDFGQKVKDAKAIFDSAMEGNRLKFQEEEKIMDAWVVGVELEKSFLAVSEKEMRQMASLGRVPRMALKGLPSITVPSHMSAEMEEETLFCFPNPEQPLRVAKLKYVMTNQLLKTKLQPQHVVYDDQGTDLQAHYVGQASTQIGYDDLVKNLGSSMDWTTFLETKLKKASREEELGPSSSGQEVRVPALSGPAAKVDNLYITPNAKTKTKEQNKDSVQTLLRGTSNMSLGSGSEHHHTATEVDHGIDAELDTAFTETGSAVESEQITGEKGRCREGF
eukprot:6492647-Amphidinium_carterae.1